MADTKPIYVENVPSTIRQIIEAEAERQGRSFSAQVRLILAREAGRIARQQASQPKEPKP